MNDPTMPRFNRTNIVAAIVIGAFSAGVLACNLYAPQYPKETAIIALFLIVTAGVLHIPLSSVVQPQVNVEQADAVNVSPRPPAVPPSTRPQDNAPSDDRPALRVPRSTK